MFNLFDFKNFNIGDNPFNIFANIKVKKLNDLAKIPTRGSEYAAGYDLYEPNVWHATNSVRLAYSNAT